MKLLQRAPLRNVLFQQFLIVLLRFVHRIDDRRPFLKVDLVSFPHTIFMVVPFAKEGAVLSDLEALEYGHLHQIE